MKNFSSLPVFNTKTVLSTRLADYSNVYFLPTICLFGMLTSLTSMIVSYRLHSSTRHSRRVSKKELQHLCKTRDYILLNSILDFAFLLVESFLFIIRCGSLCPHGYAYASKFYEIYVYLYFGYVLITAQVFFNIYVAIDMLRMLNVNYSNSRSRLFIYGMSAISLILSMAINLPAFLISKEIVAFGIYMPATSNNDSIITANDYEILYSSSIRIGFDSEIAQDLLTACLIIKNPVMYISLFVLNLLVCLKYRKYIRSKKCLVYPSSKQLFNFYYVFN